MVLVCTSPSGLIFRKVKPPQNINKPEKERKKKDLLLFIFLLPTIFDHAKNDIFQLIKLFRDKNIEGQVHWLNFICNKKTKNEKFLSLTHNVNVYFQFYNYLMSTHEILSSQHDRFHAWGTNLVYRTGRSCDRKTLGGTIITCINTILC